MEGGENHARYMGYLDLKKCMYKDEFIEILGESTPPLCSRHALVQERAV